MKTKSKILIIAGSDSSGGAGIQADIKTVTALGGYAMTAVTAVTAQNTKGVKAVFPIKTKEIEKHTIDVGDNFAEEATMIYNGKKKSKPIRGTATKKEEKKLKKEGVPYIKLPLIKDN